ncbi:MAG: FAD-dependent oxidoreductase, partial [Pseudomonadota bacterium]
MTLIRSAEALARAAGVKFVFGRKVGPDLIKAQAPDVVVTATGGRPMPAPFPGAELPHVVQAWDVLADKVDTGHKVVVIGGGAVGCEAALHLARIGTLTPEEFYFLFVNQAESPETLYQLSTRGLKEVTLVEMTARIGSDIGQSTGWIIRQDVARFGITIMKKTKALEITPQGLVVERAQEKGTLPADTVVLALGTVPENSLYTAIKDVHPQVINLGDADRPAKAYEAVHLAFAAALEV